MNINDIFNRPPAISEDTLHYTLYPLANLSDKVSTTTLAAVIQDYVNTLLPDFLWHRDTFQLKVVPNEESGEGYVLDGHMRVGDCVDDEWCAVWILWQVSKKWDVAISVSDSDGEFLLIEAAEHLPSWVTPTNAENRVWIYRSHLHLIPLSHISAPSSKPRRRKYSISQDSDNEEDTLDDTDYINVQDAMKVLRDSVENTVAPKAIEEAVWNRIHGYPQAASQHVHHAKTYLPVDVAKALSQNPTLVQKAVETFYTRDAIQLRAAHRMSRFPPEPSVLTTTKMTRTAYAQLTGQKFYPPKIFGRWPEREDTREWRWRDIGMKIACGFEMLYQESKNKSVTTNDSSPDAGKSAAEARKDALRRNPDYTTYIQNLQTTGYFQNELEGSALWVQMEDKAALAFIEARKDDDATRVSFATEVNSALSHVNGQDFVSSREEDPEDWLNVDESQFDAMLEKAAGQPIPSSSKEDPAAMDVDGNQDLDEDRIANEQAEKLKKMAKKVEEFLEGKGDVDGARFQDEDFSDDEFREDDSDDENENVDMFEEDEDEDEDEFASQTLVTEDERAAREEAMSKLVPGIDPSDYGKMPPSYHANSQRVKPATVETDVVEEISTPGVTSKPESKKRTIRPPILPRDKYEGVDSDDETDEEGDIDSEDEEDQPQVVGDVEIDMNEEEDEFLEFARQALGLTDDQWKDIVKDRKDRGAFVPSSILVGNNKPVDKEGTPSAPTSDASQKLRSPEPGPRPNTNPNLDSFEAVMQAMDAELARSRSERQKPASTSKDKGKGKEKESVEDVDIESAMDAELRAALESLEEDEDEDSDETEKLDYNLIKNFLESFKSQGGLSGPVGNLMGRLQPDWKLPRDES